MKLVIVDRDGVINRNSDDYIKSEQEWQPLPGSLKALARLNSHGYHLIVATNQAGLARGKLSLGTLHKIHRKMHSRLAQYGGVIDAVFFCPHAPEDGCACRKPNPGLFMEIEKRLRVSLHDVAVIGDASSDVEAALAVGASPMVVRTGRGQSQLDAGLIPDDIPVYDDLAQAAAAILDAGGSP